MPTTSQVNVGRYNEFFRPFVEQGLPVIYLAFSSKWLLSKCVAISRDVKRRV